MELSSALTAYLVIMKSKLPTLLEKDSLKARSLRLGCQARVKDVTLPLMI